MAPTQKPGRSRQDYRTPPLFLDAVRRRFGLTSFAIALAASEENTVAPLFYTEAENALVQPWRTASRDRAYCNPPFADIGPWVKKACKESTIGARVLMLVPAGVGANWWRDWVDGQCLALFLNGRITFVGETTPYPKDCVLLVYGPDVAPGHAVWSWATKASPLTAGVNDDEPWVYSVRLKRTEIEAVARGEMPATLVTYSMEALASLHETPTESIERLRQKSA
jgi:phage N-6-adenine-methyltransferase